MEEIHFRKQMHI